MGRLSEMKGNVRCTVTGIEGTRRFVGRVTAFGITENAVMDVIQNRGRNPLLVFTRDSTVAISRREARNIIVEEVQA